MYVCKRMKLNWSSSTFKQIYIYNKLVFFLKANCETGQLSKGQFLHLHQVRFYTGLLSFSTKQLTAWTNPSSSSTSHMVLEPPYGCWLFQRLRIQDIWEYMPLWDASVNCCLPNNLSYWKCTFFCYPEKDTEFLSCALCYASLLLSQTSAKS